MAKKADILLINSKIYITDNNSWAEAMTISKGKIAFIGTNLEAQAWIGKKTKVINLEQKLVLPSFIDSHVHPIWAGMSLSECDLFEQKTKAQVLKTIKEYIKSHSREKWVTGTGWNLAVFTHGNPKKEWLDNICPNKPIFLFSNDYHSAWVNSKALELAGITQNTPDPPHGQIERNFNNEPSGTLRESAIELVKQRIPAANLNKKLRGLKKALKIMNSLGITLKDPLIFFSLG